MVAPTTAASSRHDNYYHIVDFTFAEKTQANNTPTPVVGPPFPLDVFTRLQGVAGEVWTALGIFPLRSMSSMAVSAMLLGGVVPFQVSVVFGQPTATLTDKCETDGSSAHYEETIT